MNIEILNSKCFDHMIRKIKWITNVFLKSESWHLNEANQLALKWAVKQVCKFTTILNPKDFSLRWTWKRLCSKLNVRTARFASSAATINFSRKNVKGERRGRREWSFVIFRRFPHKFNCFSLVSLMRFSIFSYCNSYKLCFDVYFRLRYV